MNILRRSLKAFQHASKFKSYGYIASIFMVVLVPISVGTFNQIIGGEEGGGG